MKVCFLSWHFDNPTVFLDTLLKMTPGCKGKWKDMEAVTDPFEADFCAIFDGYNGKYPKDRALFFGQHPLVEQHSPAFRRWENQQALGRYALDEHLNAGEWWIGHTYDELDKLKYERKSRNLCCVMTYQTHIPMYEQRVKFMEGFTSRFKEYDLYGRPEENFKGNKAFNSVYRGALGNNTYNAYLGEHLIGKEKVGEYRYSLEYDVGPTKNYISERFYDAMLLWTMPIYFGSSNVQDFLPENSFQYIDLYGEPDSEALKVLDYVYNDFVEHHIKDLAEARNMLLTKYQTWPYVYNKIKEL